MFYDKVSESALYIKEKIDRIPELCVILGSGLGSLVDLLEDKVVLPYSEIPNFPVSTVEGHAGEFIFGHIGGVDLVFMSGRFHYYEGFTMKEVTFPVSPRRSTATRKCCVLLMNPAQSCAAF